MNDITEMLDLYIDARKNSTPSLTAYIITSIQIILLISGVYLLFNESVFIGLLMFLIGSYGLFNLYIIIMYHRKKIRNKAY